MKKFGRVATLSIYGIGFAISGEITGWHFGWTSIGIQGFFYLFAVAAILYMALARIQVELGTLVPEADGPHCYAERAFPTLSWLAKLTQFAVFVEFLFASPYISDTFGQYLSLAFRTNISGETISIITIVVIGILKVLSPNIENKMIMIVTIIGILELIYYFSTVSPNVSFNNISPLYESDSLSFLDYFRELPTAMWMFLGIEGISLIANRVTKSDTSDRKEILSYSYTISYVVIVVLAFLVLLLTASSVIWTAPVYTQFTDVNNLHPLPTILKSLLGDTIKYRAMLGLGMFGLGASLIAIFFASIDQLKLLGTQYERKTKLNDRKSEILYTLLTVTLVIASTLLKIQEHLLYISVFGAMIMYVIVSVSLLYIRWIDRRPPQFNTALTIISVVTLSVLALATMIGFCSSRPICATAFVFLFVIYLFSQFAADAKAK